MFDLLLIETLNGGDLQKKGNDLAIIQGWENMPYLALFGHRGGVTKTQYSTNEFRPDWFGNNLLHPNEPAAQINSRTEDALHTQPLTSAGRLAIEDAINADLVFMRAFAEVKVETAIIATNNLRIRITVQQPNNLEQREFLFLWDALKQELTSPNNTYTPNPTPVAGGLFDYYLPFYL